MFTNKVEELKQQGFSVKKTRDVQTIIEHKESFFVKGSAGDVKSPYNDETGTYMVTVSGYETNGQLSESFRRPHLPFLTSINESALNAEREKNSQQEQVNDDSLAEKTFSELAEGDIFYKADDASSVKFVKIDEIAYRRSDSSIGGSLDLYAKDDDKVFVVEMMDDISVLTPEQKQDIVDHTPKGLDHDSFVAHVADEIDNIAGLEMLNDDELSDLIDELYGMYR